MPADNNEQQGCSLRSRQELYNNNNNNNNNNKQANNDITINSPAALSLFPGDEQIPHAAMIYDRTRLIRAPPSSVWPWVVQMGKNRAGWYLPASVERWLPSHWPASHKIEPRWQSLAVGDRVDDYGTNSEGDYFDVVAVDAPTALVYRSERYGTSFTWAILLRPLVGEGGRAEGTMLHLRFRGSIASKGWRKRLIVVGGDWLDWITTAPMLMGLAERAEGEHHRD